MKYRSTKTWENAFPVSYRQWRADSHCKFWHGYALTIHVEFESEELDVRNWVVDFGGLKPLKMQLEEWFDHKFLVALDDPYKDEIEKFVRTTGVAEITFVEKTGCEGISEFLYEYINTIYLPNVGEAGRVWCTKVEVRETPSNMAMVIGERGDFDVPSQTEN